MCERDHNKPIVSVLEKHYLDSQIRQSEIPGESEGLNIHWRRLNRRICKGESLWIL